MTNVTKLEKVQRKALRFIHNKYKRTDSPTNLAAISGLETLSSRAQQARLKFLFHLMHNYYKIDVSKYISFSQSRPSRHKHAAAITEYSCHNDTFMYSYFPLVIREWNRLDPSIITATTLSQFTSRIESLSINE